MVREAASKFDCVQFMREARARMDAETEGLSDDWADLKEMPRDAVRCRFDGVAAEFARRSQRAVRATFFE